MGSKRLKTGKSTKLVIRKSRVFSDSFKRELVVEIVSGRQSIASVSKLWDVATQTIYTWIYKYSPDHKKGTIMVVQKESEASKLLELQKKLAELERVLGQKQMVIDFQEKLIELASKELDIDIKKKFSPGF